MFSTAKTVAPAKKKKSEKVEVKLAGLENLAAIDAVIKALTALKETIDGDVKTQMRDHFVKIGCEAKKRPENFKGAEGNATASCELRLRSSKSGLSDVEEDLCKKYSIPTESVCSITETFIINPAYKDDTKLLGEIEKKLKTIKGIPDDLFMKQEGVTTTVVSADALDTMFTLDTATATRLLPVVGCLAIKPKLTTSDVGEAFKLVKALIDPEADETDEVTE